MSQVRVLLRGICKRLGGFCEFISRQAHHV
jgi:hypothetical protein